MSSSNELLLKIKKINTDFISYLTEIKNLKSSVDDSVNVYTTFFKNLEPIIHKYNDLYDYNAIQTLIKEISLFNREINDEIYKNCSHEFETMEVDVDVERTISVTLCKVCELEKL